MKKWKMKSMLISLIGIVSLVPITSLLVVSCSNNKTQAPSNNQEQPSAPSTPSVTQDLDIAGGSFNNLNVDKCSSTIQLLNLNNNTVLSSLDSNNLTQQLRTHEGYENMSINILDGSSEKTGILRLRLSGRYYNNNYNEEVNVRGFNTINSNSFRVIDLEINERNYFDNQFPIKEASTLSIPNDLNKRKSIISNAQFEINNNFYSFDEMCSRYELKNINLELEHNDLNFNFEFSTKFKVYNNGAWIIDNQQDALNQWPTYSVKLLTLNDLMKFMLNEFTLNTESIKGFYPSYFKGLFDYSVGLKADRTNLIRHLNFQSIIDKYKNVYFNQLNIYPEIDISSESRMQANDFNGTLSFDVNLVNHDAFQIDRSITRNFTSNSMKTITSYLETKKDTINSIIINDDDNSSMAKQIKRIYNQEILNAFIESKEQEIQLDPNHLSMYLNNQWISIFNIEAANNSEDTYIQKIDSLKKSYGLSLFGEYLNEFGYLENQSNKKPNFDLNTGLFTTNDGNQFYIANASFVFEQDKLNPILKMESNTNVVRIEFKAKINYSLLDQEFSQETNFSLTITRSSIVGR